jgi:hypothetical protein
MRSEYQHSGNRKLIEYGTSNFREVAIELIDGHLSPREAL